MKKFLTLLSLLCAAFLIHGCSHDEITQPDNLTVSGQDNLLDKGHGRGGNQPQFTTMHWPPPEYPVGVMTLDHRDGEGTHVTNLDIGFSHPVEEGDYLGFITPYGIAFNRNGTAYSINNWFDGNPDNCFSQVIKMDLETGTVEPIGPIHTMNFAGPEFDRDGNLYATGFTVGPPEDEETIYVWGDSYLYKFDVTTGEKIQIGDTGSTLWMDLDFDSEGRLWGTYSNDLYTIDTETGASTFVTHVDGVEDNWIPGVCEEDWEYMEIMGIAFDRHDVLWATAMKGFSNCVEGGVAVPFMTIDIEAGQANLVGSSILDGQSHGGDIPPAKVTVCHRSGNGRFHAIEVPWAAVAAHLAHGDYLPENGGDDCGCDNDDDEDEERGESHHH